VLAPTTDFRAFWDTLSGDVLADRGDRATVAAIVALQRADRPPWAPALADALAATAQILAIAAPFADPATTSLGALAEPAPPAHPTGLPATDAAGSCGTCAWRHDSRGASRCRHAGARVDPTWPACERYEAVLDCQSCGACCRAAYHSVELSRRDPAVRAHPELVVDRGTYLELARSGDRCAALAGGEPEHDRITRYRCTIYDDRPRTCRDFTVGSEHCLTARRRVGLTLGGTP
jgi:Fe-S-cluster containining protein